MAHVHCIAPEMILLLKIVIPKIKVDWEDVAYTLHYRIMMVKMIKEKHRGDPKKCCKELFEDWLTTSNGVHPKTWRTLLDRLNELVDLTLATQVIKQELSGMV